MNAKSTHRPKNSFRGVFVALVTPMKADEEVDYPKLAELAAHLIRQGIHGLAPLGSTGEYYALSGDERERVLRTTLEAAAGRVPVIAGTNAGSTREVIAYSRQAEKLGCTGIMLAAPYYSLPRPEELLVHFKAVNNAIGVPIVVYNYPGRNGVDMTPDLLERLAELRNVRYVKESTGEMPRIANLWANRLNADSLLPESRRFTRSNLDRIQTDPTSDSSYGKVPRGKTRPVYTEIPPLMKSGLFGPVRIITPTN